MQSLPSVIPATAGYTPLVKALAQRNMLVTMRLVSSGWCKAGEHRAEVEVGMC